MVIVIDNYDSFTYNIVQYLGELHPPIEVYRNDEITLLDIQIKQPDFIVISPGPCTPNEAGISLRVIEEFSGKIPILGICLGHQTIAQAFGGKITQANRLMHGKTSPIYHDGKKIFQNIPQVFLATRYHSLIIEKEYLPSCLEVTAQTEEGEIMGIRHKEFAVEGLQFHPESILTEHGKELLGNYIEQYVAKNVVKMHEVDV